MTADAHDASGGREVDIKTVDMSDWYGVTRVGETHAAAKVLIEEGTFRILGAHLLRPEASELIKFFGLAMRTGLTAADVKRLVSAYPSAASDLGYLVRRKIARGSPGNATAPPISPGYLGLRSASRCQPALGEDVPLQRVEQLRAGRPVRRDRPSARGGSRRSRG